GRAGSSTHRDLTASDHAALSRRQFWLSIGFSENRQPLFGPMLQTTGKAMNLTRIDDPHDPRIAAYLDIRERDLAGRQGRFIAEGKVVLDVLLSARRFATESILVLENRLAGLIDILAKAPESLPVHVVTGEVMDQIAGFHMHRGILAIG